MAGEPSQGGSVSPLDDSPDHRGSIESSDQEPARGQDHRQEQHHCGAGVPGFTLQWKGGVSQGHFANSASQGWKLTLYKDRL